LLAFRVFADHVPTVVDDWLLFLLRLAVRMGPGPGLQVALGAGTCGSQVTRASEETRV
jgi:hypothetical protein